MEAAGLAVGIVSIYNASIDILSRFDAYKNFGAESQVTIVHFDASKIKLQDWAKSVGIRDGKLVDVHDARLDDPLRGSIIKNALGHLKKVFDKVEYTSSSIRLPLRQRSAGIDDWVTPFDETMSKLEHRQCFSKRSQMAWATGGKAKLNKDVSIFEGLVNVLYDVVNPCEFQSGAVITSSQPEANEDPLSDSEVNLKKLQEHITALNRRDALDWLDALKNDDEHGKHVSLHLDGTCRWVSAHPAYVSWESNNSSDVGARFLWIHGPAGFGKTVLSAWLIQYLKETSELPLAYCFSSSHAQGTDRFDSVVRTWITHLAQGNMDVLRLCQSVRRKQDARRASRDDIWNLLKEISIQVQSCILVLDGLDEFDSTDDTRSVFLHEIKKAVASTRARVLITSRNEVDIESELSASATQPPKHIMLECKVTKDNVKGDVDLYSQSVVAKKFSRHGNSFRRELAAQMVARCDGMFLWIKLQQGQLRGTQNGKTVQRIVQSMPQGLYHTYKRSWDSIQNLVEPNRNRAVEILRWLTFGYRALTVQEMAEALIIEIDEASDAFCRDDLPEEIDAEYSNNEIKGLCGSLIELRGESEDPDPQSNTVHLVHASVREYLIATLPVPSLVKSLPSQALSSTAHHVKIAALCLRFLNCSQAYFLDECGGVCSFTDYAVRSWFRHLRDSGEYYHRVSGLVCDFMKLGNTYFECWQTLYEYTTVYPGRRLRGLKASPMYYACLFGLLPVMDFLHDNESEDINFVGGQSGTPLQAVIKQGYTEAFDRLMSWGADVTAVGGQFDNALNAAAYHGRYQMVKALIERDGLTDPLILQSRQATKTAAGQGHVEVVRLLLDQIAEIAAKDASPGEKLTLLSESLLVAAENGHPVVAGLLLGRGADVDARNENNDTSIHLAVRYNHTDVVKVLAQRNVNLNLHGSEGPPLNSAASLGHFEVAAQLIGEGADVQIRANGDMSPLHEAAYNDHADIAALLLSQGANINAQNTLGKTPLYLALEMKNMDVITMLLDKEADVNVQTAKGWTPSHAAAEKGLLDIVTSLIQRGADVNIQSSTGWTPLHNASIYGHVDIAELLLQHGALTKKDKWGWTPLHLAAERAELEVTARLIQLGADINARDQYGWTPLHIAIHPQIVIGEQRCLKEVESLLERGALYCADDEGWVPLHMAAESGYNDIMNLFLDQGQSINAQSNCGMTPLHVAIYKNHIDTAKLLLSQGADVNISTKNGTTTLHLAVEKGNLDFVRTLLAKGCNLNVKGNFGDTPLRKAIERASDELVEEMINCGANLSAIDCYGMKCSDWLRRLRPNLVVSWRNSQDLDNTPSGPDLAVLRRTTSKFAAAVRKGSQEMSAEFYHLSHCLLMLDMDDDARLAYQQSVLAREDGSVHVPSCNGCMMLQNKVDPFYTCKTCPEIDLCYECFTKREKKGLLELCRDHQFLKVSASEAKIRPDQTEALNHWLLGLEEQFRPT